MTASYTKNRLIDIAEINPPRTADIASEHIVAFVPLGAIDQTDIIKPDYKKLGQLDSDCRFFQRGDILLPRIASGLHKQKIIMVLTDEEFGFCTREFFVIRANNELVNPRYLYHWLRQQSCKELIHLLQGTALKRVPSNAIGQLFINLPERDQQDVFARTMDIAAERKALCERQVQNADKTIVGLFLDWVRRFRTAPEES